MPILAGHTEFRNYCRSGSYLNLRSTKRDVSYGGTHTIFASAMMRNDTHCSNRYALPAERNLTRNSLDNGAYYIIDPDLWDPSEATNYVPGLGSDDPIVVPAQAILAGPIYKPVGEYLSGSSLSYTFTNLTSRKLANLIYISRGGQLNAALQPMYWMHWGSSLIVDVAGVECASIYRPASGQTYTINQGEDLYLTVGAIGDPDIYYQWVKSTGLMHGNIHPRAPLPPTFNALFATIPPLTYSDLTQPSRNSLIQRGNRTLSIKNARCDEDGGTYFAWAYNGRQTGPLETPMRFRCAEASPKMTVNVLCSATPQNSFQMPNLTRAFSFTNKPSRDCDTQDAPCNDNGCYIEWVTARIYDCSGDLINNTMMGWFVRNNLFGGRRFLFAKRFTVQMFGAGGRAFPLTGGLVAGACGGVPTQIKWKVGCVHRSWDSITMTATYDNPFTVEFDEYADNVKILADDGSYGQTLNYDLGGAEEKAAHPCNVEYANARWPGNGFTQNDCNSNSILWAKYPDNFPDNNPGAVDEKAGIGGVHRSDGTLPGGDPHPMYGNYATHMRDVDYVSHHDGANMHEPQPGSVTVLPDWDENAARQTILRNEEWTFLVDKERPDVNNSVMLAQKCSQSGLGDVEAWFFFPPLITKRTFAVGAGAAGSQAHEPTFSAQFPLYKEIIWPFVGISMIAEREINNADHSVAVGDPLLDKSSTTWHGKTSYHLPWSEIIRAGGAGPSQTLIDNRVMVPGGGMDTSNGKFRFAIACETSQNTKQKPHGELWQSKLYARGMAKQSGMGMGGFEEENDTNPMGGQGTILTPDPLTSNNWVGKENRVSEPVLSAGKSFMHKVFITRNVEGATFSTVHKVPEGRVPCPVTAADWTNPPKDADHTYHPTNAIWASHQIAWLIGNNKQRVVQSRSPEDAQGRTTERCCDNWVTPDDWLIAGNVDEVDVDGVMQKVPRTYLQGGYDPYDVTDGEVQLTLNKEFKGFRRDLPDWIWVEDYVENMTSEYLLHFDLSSIFPAKHTPCKKEGLDGKSSYCDGTGASPFDQSLAGVGADHKYKETYTLFTNTTGHSVWLIPVSYFEHNTIKALNLGDQDTRDWAELSADLARPECFWHSEGALSRGTLDFEINGLGRGDPAAGGKRDVRPCAGNGMGMNPPEPCQLKMQWSKFLEIHANDVLGVSLEQDCEDAMWALGQFIIVSDGDRPAKGAQYPLFESHSIAYPMPTRRSRS